jgi:hypothetical protein
LSGQTLPLIVVRGQQAFPLASRWLPIHDGPARSDPAEALAGSDPSAQEWRNHVLTAFQQRGCGQLDAWQQVCIAKQVGHSHPGEPSLARTE